MPRERPQPLVVLDKDAVSCFLVDSLLVGYDSNRNVSSMRIARGAEEASPQEQARVGEGVWSLATDEEASAVGYRHGGSLADNNPPSRQLLP